MPKGYTIRIFVAEGEPDGIRLIDKMNWTGLGFAFPRSAWPKLRNRPEFARAGVYVLVGHGENDDLPTIYVGEGDGIKDRIDNHFANKDFWDSAIAFVSNGSGLNKAHVQWLEHNLIQRAEEAAQCLLDNGNSPQKPALSEHEEADVSAFLEEMLRIVPLIGIRAFEKPKQIVPQTASVPTKPTTAVETDKRDTIVVPAHPDGFEQVFLGENRWRTVRISGGMLPKIKYVAAYVSQPVKAITHVAEVDHIEPYGDQSKYQIVFKGPAKKVGPIPFGDAPSGYMQGPKYASFAKLIAATKLSEIFS